MNKTLKETIDANVAFLSKRKNWIKGAFNGKKGQHCILGSTRAINGPKQYQAEQIFAAAINELYPSRVRKSNDVYSEIVSFNDHDNTRHQHVVRVCKRAAELAAALDAITKNSVLADVVKAELK
jgi:hypothetical protein